MAKLNKFAKKAAELDAWADVLQYAEHQKENNMAYKEGENGKCITDANGNYITIPPEEDDYRYTRYIGWCEVVKALENMKI